MNTNVRQSTLYLSLALTFGACGSDKGEGETMADKYGALAVADDYDRPIESLVAEAPGVGLTAESESFALRMMNLANADNVDTNVLVSPLSAALALGMTMNGANGETLAAMLTGLGYEGQSLKDVNSYLADVSRSLVENDQVTIELANSIWAREDYSPLKRSFYEVVTEYYGADIFPLAGVDPINEWVADATHDKITNLLQDLPSDAAMVLVNALYFNGKWLDAFDKSGTDSSAFRAPGGNVQADTMHITSEDIRYKRGLDYQAVAIPYQDKRTSLYVVVPNDESLDAFSESLLAGSSGGYYDWSWETDDFEWVEDQSETLFSGFLSGEVRLDLPKFSFDFERNLEEDLKALGMDVIFDPNAADFTNFAENKAPWVDKVVQKTFIDVNEEGTEAAAATAVVMLDSAVGTRYELNVDRPFLFFVRDDRTGVLLFAGQVNDPTS
ncbi:MAG: serpin family protein [Polyangiaceae bacterium]|nr:serpin family protein [Polyangiaceae bacterium]